MRWRNTSVSTFAGSAGTGSKAAVVETLDAVDDLGNVIATLNKAVDGTVSFTVDGSPVGGGGGTYETPTGDVDGNNDTFTFTAPPILVFRNGVMEKRLGTIDGNDFVFDTAPETDDDIEGLV